jgi:hypothetical protein
MLLQNLLQNRIICPRHRDSILHIHFSRIHLPSYFSFIPTTTRAHPYILYTNPFSLSPPPLSLFLLYSRHLHGCLRALQLLRAAGPQLSPAPAPSSPSPLPLSSLLHRSSLSAPCSCADRAVRAPCQRRWRGGPRRRAYEDHVWFEDRWMVASWRDE